MYEIYALLILAHFFYALKELYDACDKMRPQLFRLASSATEDGDEGLGETCFPVGYNSDIIIL